MGIALFSRVALLRCTRLRSNNHQRRLALFGQHGKLGLLLATHRRTATHKHKVCGLIVQRTASASIDHLAYSLKCHLMSRARQSDVAEDARKTCTVGIR
jgi:hypothetical protein